MKDPQFEAFSDIGDTILRVETIIQNLDKVVATLKEERVVQDKGKVVVIEEHDKGKAPMTEERLACQPPKKVHIYTRKKNTIKKQMTIATPTQSEESREPSPQQKLMPLSPSHYSTPQIIEPQSPPRGPSPPKEPPIKRKRVELVGLVDYLADGSDEEIFVTKD